MDKKQVLDYVMTTPQNTNPAILSQMIDEMGEGGSNIDVTALNITENGTYTAQAGYAYSPVTVSVQSEESFFTTANVTIKGYIPGGPLFFGNDGGSQYTPIDGIMCIDSTYYLYNENISLDPAYDYNCEVLIINSPGPYFEISTNNVTVTGDATVEGGDGIWKVYITGDCTITIS